MSAAISLSDHQRAHGELRVELRRRGEETVLAGLRQDGCLKARFPRPVAWTEVVMLNTSGGIAGGDRLRTEIVARSETRVTVAAQAAERFYRALPADPPAHIRSTVTVEDGAATEWLPQETILFDGSALDRVLEVNLTASGSFLGVETLVFGRAAMGETVRTARLSDTIRIRRDGRLVLHDAVRLNGEVAAVLDRPAIAQGGRAIATIVLAARDAGERLDSLREALAGAPAEAGASAWNGLLVGRIVAADGASLRAAIVAGLECLREGRTLPRVWMC